MTLLKVMDLAIEYRTPEGAVHRAVDGVSFSLAPGETIGIVGESGSGKSTLARALLGYMRPGSDRVSGSVTLDGEDLFAITPRRLAALRGGKVALIPQQPLSALAPHFRVGAQVAEVIRTHRAVSPAKARIEVLRRFEQTRLPDPATLATRYPHQISGGQRQRVVIAAGLAGSPQLLVLDEPTTALDKTTEADVLALIRQLQAELGTALVYVSHDLHVIRAMCSRVLVMRGGRVVEDGPTEQVFLAPRSAYARSLVAATLSVDPRKPRIIPASTQAPLLTIDRLSFSYRKAGLLSGPASPRVLSDVSLSIQRGESFGIVGESGSGKSTLAALVVGLATGATGSMQFDGNRLSGTARQRSRDLRRRIQLVFQDPLPSLNPAHTVEYIITRPLAQFFGTTGAAARKAAERLMEEMELDPVLIGRRPTELSGGQQQRVALARALAADPDLIVCDEVTSALDVTIQAQVIQTLKRLLNERGTTFIFISHDLGFIAEMTDNLLVLEKGIGCESGSTATVLATPSHPYTRRLLAAYRGQQHAGQARSEPATHAA